MNDFLFTHFIVATTNYTALPPAVSLAPPSTVEASSRSLSLYHRWVRHGDNPFTTLTSFLFCHGAHVGE